MTRKGKGTYKRNPLSAKHKKAISKGLKKHYRSGAAPWNSKGRNAPKGHPFRGKKMVWLPITNRRGRQTGERLGYKDE